MTARTRLVLVGGGHSHLEIVRRQILEHRDDVDLTLLSSGTLHHYSGMVPGYLRGTYSERQIAFDLPPLLERAGGQFLAGQARAVDPGSQKVVLADGRSVDYDLVSFGVGSSTRGGRADDVRAHAWTVKPIGRAVALRRRLTELAGQDVSPVVRAVVVGAGAAGYEVACAIAGVLDEAGRRRVVILADAAERILEGYSDRFRRRALGLLERKRISLRLGSAVSEVRPAAVCFAQGEEIPSDLTVWLTGAEAYDLFAGSGLALDSRGFLLVDDSLRSVSDPRIFGVGDCATLESHPQTPRAGVYAVREGPILWRSLIATLEGRPLPRYSPQKGFLSILNTADGKSLLRYGAIVSYSRAAWKLKDGIDRRFMRRYQQLAKSTVEWKASGL
jgi:selenide, water dikinase